METSMDCNDQHVEYKNAKKVKWVKMDIILITL